VAEDGSGPGTRAICAIAALIQHTAKQVQICVHRQETYMITLNGSTPLAQQHCNGAWSGPMQKWQLQYAGRALIVFALALFASAAMARPERSERRQVRRGHDTERLARGERQDEVPPAVAGSISVGRTTRGRLVAGVPLMESENLQYRSGGPELRFGTTEMVQTLERAAAHVARAVPGAKLAVGDISRRNGGRFSPHRSHRNGRDVDIAFYWLDAAGNPTYPPRFVTATADGVSRDTALGLRFDDARNFELVSAMVSDQEARVQYLFVAGFVKARILAEGVRREAPDWLLERIETVLHQPRRGGAHRDHFHMRIYCAEDDRPRCVDEAPYHPWLQTVPSPQPSLHARLAPGVPVRFASTPASLSPL
jgi:penicillin-insensitive murein endopeptidase